MKDLRTRNNKLINFILEFSQVLLVFLGVYSAIMCAAFGLELSFDRGLLTLVMFLASILFYGLFSVLETFRRGKLYGILGITAFYAVLMFRFLGAVKKGWVTIINSFLKQFMNYTGSTLNLLAYKDTESASVTFCTTLVLILLGVYFVALISAFFYRKRRSTVFIVLTIPLVFVPLAVGRMGYFSNMLTYLVVLIAVVGSRHLRTDATDRRMRQKLSLILMIVGLAVGGLSYFVVPPDRYERNENKILQAKNSVIALANWSAEDVFTWVKSYFNDDAIDYGRIGKKNEVSYSGETLVKISGKVNADYGLYLKGYVGDTYENNRWYSLTRNEEYVQDLQKLEDSAVTLDNWHVQLRNELGENETSGVSGIWNQGTLRIRNLAFGYGNYLVPYLPADSFKYEDNGHITIEHPGIDYVVTYYPVYPVVQRKGVLDGNISIANHVFWEGNAVERQQLTEFARKYYMQVPETVKGVCDDFSAFLKERGIQAVTGGDSGYEAKIIAAVKDYIMKDTEYTLAPGKTPSGKDSVGYFLTENKKGYCVYYATAATVLLRSAGVPARYAEGMYVPKEELAECDKGKEIAVPDRNAHAWVEVYNEKYGFVPVEVTPGFGEEGVSNTSTENTDNNNHENAEGQGKMDEKPEEKIEEKPKEATPTPVVSETPQEDMIFDDIERDGDNTSSNAASEGGSSKTSRIIWKIVEITVIVLLVLAVIEGQRRIRKYIFERNLRRLRMRKRIRMVHHHLNVLLVQRGVVYRRQTMAEYTKEISVAMEMPYDKIYDYVTLVYRARFGPDDITEEDMAVFRITYENIRRKAYENAKLLKKIYYMYIMVL